MNTQTETVQTEQFYCEPSCKCTNRMDIRGRCNPTHDPLTWENCGAKIDSTFFYIQHNYDEYKQYDHLCEPGVRQERNDIIASIAVNGKYGLQLGDEVDDLLELFNKEDESDCKYNCICCDNFVHTDEEYNCRTDGDKEGIICWDCLPEHFCEDCDRFCESKLKPNNCGKYICDICEESRLEAIKEEEQEKANEIKKLNKVITASWELVKKETESWIKDVVNQEGFTDDIARREDLISALNVMLGEFGIEPIDL